MGGAAHSNRRRTFIGSQAAVAFVGADGAEVRYNTIDRLRRDAVRILQETAGPGFVPSRDGRFTGNLIAFRSAEMILPVNIDPGTTPGPSRPRLLDPRLRYGEGGDLRHRMDGPTGRVGTRAKDIGPKGGRP